MPQTMPRRRTASLPVRAAAVFVATRLLCLVALAVDAHRHRRALGAVLTVFDGGYYRQIATHWYPHALAAGPPGALAPSPLAFFPLYPSLLGVLRLAGVPVPVGALLVDTVAGAAAAALIAVTVRRWTSDRTGLLTAALWSVYPLGVVLTLAYPEALFTLLATGALLALCDERWALAGACVALACLTRPTGVVLVAVVVAVAIRHRQVRALMVATAGLVAYLGWMAYLAVLTGSPTAWFTTERRGWGVYFDAGLDNATRAAHYLLRPSSRPAATVVGLLLVGVVVLVVAAWFQPLPRRYWLFAALLVLVAVGSRNTYSSIPRFLLPAFPLLVPVAALLARVPRAVAWTAVVVAAAAMAAAGVYLAFTSTYPP